MSLDFRRLGRCEYLETVWLQAELVRQRRTGEVGDTVLLLEHEPVITVGRGGAEATEPGRRRLLRNIPVVETSRGGQATYHGPGQLVAYPVLDLRGHRMDLHWYLRRLEQVVVLALQRLGLEGRRVEGLTGVWVGPRKVCSIGVAVRGWVTYHGLALNVDCEMEAFHLFSPCGLRGEDMGRLRDYDSRLTVAGVLPVLEGAFRDTLECGTL